MLKWEGCINNDSLVFGRFVSRLKSIVFWISRSRKCILFEGSSTGHLRLPWLLNFSLKWFQVLP